MPRCLNLVPDGTVLDGEILPFHGDVPVSFNFLQTRIGRKTLSPKLPREVPVAFVACDVLEWEGEDIHTWPFEQHRRKLEEICPPNNSVLRLSSALHMTPGRSWRMNGVVRGNS